MTLGPIGTDDWGSIIGANSPTLYTAPHLLMSGPIFRHVTPTLFYELVKVGTQSFINRF